MNVDRTRFLKLAVAIASATTTTAACSAAPAEDEAGDGSGAQRVAGMTPAETGSCDAADAIEQPGRGSLAPFAYAEGFCFDLAVHEVDASQLTPKDEGIGVRFFDFVYDQCRMYSSQLQPAVAAKVQECLTRENDKRGRNADGAATQEFSATAMYDCGKEALWNVCKADGRVNSGGRCDRIADALKRPATYRPASTRTREALVGECSRVLSGMKTSARAAIERCVMNEGWDLYTCVEGLSVDFSDRATDEPAPSGSDACVAASAATPAIPADACEKVVAKMEAQGEFVVSDFALAHCKMYASKFSPPAAKAAIDCLMDPAKTYGDIYACGQLGLKRVCKDASVDDACKGIVSAITAVDPDANKGGKLTRQCRALMPGLKRATQTEVAACVPNLASRFGRSLAQYAFYSCVEGLDP